MPFSGAFGEVGAKSTSDLRRVVNFESAFAAQNQPNQHALVMRHDAIKILDRKSRSSSTDKECER